MILFFQDKGKILAVSSQVNLNQADIDKLTWLFREAHALPSDHLTGEFYGPRKEMITPWSTNAVEITQNMGIKGIDRIEEFFVHDGTAARGHIDAKNRAQGVLEGDVS